MAKTRSKSAGLDLGGDPGGPTVLTRASQWVAIEESLPRNDSERPRLYALARHGEWIRSLWSLLPGGEMSPGDVAAMGATHWFELPEPPA